MPPYLNNTISLVLTWARLNTKELYNWMSTRTRALPLVFILQRVLQDLGFQWQLEISGFRPNRQGSVARSTTETELISMNNGLYGEVCNIQSFLEQLVQGPVDICIWQDSNSVSYRVWKPDIRRNLGIVAACVGSTLIFDRNHFQIQLWEPSAAQLTWWRPTDWPKSFNRMAGFQLCTSMIYNKTTCSLQFEIDCACVALPDLYIRMQGLDDQVSRGGVIEYTA